MSSIFLSRMQSGSGLLMKGGLVPSAWALRTTIVSLAKYQTSVHCGDFVEQIKEFCQDHFPQSRFQSSNNSRSRCTVAARYNEVSRYREKCSLGTGQKVQGARGCSPKHFKMWWLEKTWPTPFIWHKIESPTPKWRLKTIWPTPYKTWRCCIIRQNHLL